MKRLKVINKKMSPKTKSQIRGWLTFCAIIIIVVLFVALVLGLALGLKKNDGCPSGQSSCSGNCKHLHSDPENCGKCGNVCPLDAECINGHCAFCAVNCSLDADMCSIDPCNTTTGCARLDCNNDNNMCTTGTCDPTTGCPAVNCSNDNNVCTIFPCNPATGCTPFDCNGDNDPCTTEPCNPILGCAYVCTTLQLSPPNTNFSATYADFKTARAIVGSGLTIGSLTNIQSVAITISPSGSGGTFAYTAGSSGITDSGLSGDTITLSGNAQPSVWQTVLRTLTYTNAAFTGTTATFSFEVTNLSLKNPSSPVSTITV